MKVFLLSFAFVAFMAAPHPMFAQADEHPLPTAVTSVPTVLIPTVERKLAPSLIATDSNDQSFSLRSVRGKVVLLNFWATWCGGCKFELPWFVSFDHDYRNRGLDVVGISMDDEGMKVVKPFLQSHHIDYPSISGNDQIAATLHLSGMPTSILIDRNGRIAAQESGVIDRTTFDKAIQQVLAEK